MTAQKPSFKDLLDRARRGTDEDWEFIDNNLGPEHLTLERVQWAIDYGLKLEEHENVRDLAATVLARSDVELRESEKDLVLAFMDSDPHEPVRHWLANALFKRGSREQEVVDMWIQACRAETPAGEFARDLR